MWPPFCASNAHAIGVGNQDRRFQHAALLNPMCSGHVTVAVAGKETREDAGPAVLPERQYYGGARSNGPFSVGQPSALRLLEFQLARDRCNRPERSLKDI